MLQNPGSGCTSVSGSQEQEVYLLGLACCHLADGEELFRRWSIVYPALYGGSRERFEQLLNRLAERGEIAITWDSEGWRARPLPAGRARFLRGPTADTDH